MGWLRMTMMSINLSDARPVVIGLCTGRPMIAVP